MSTKSSTGMATRRKAAQDALKALYHPKYEEWNTFDGSIATQDLVEAVIKELDSN